MQELHMHATHLVLDALGLLIVQVLLDVLGVHHRDDGVQLQLLGQALVHEEGLGDRGRVCQAGCLDQDGVEASLALQQLVEDLHQVPAQCRAQLAESKAEDRKLMPQSHSLATPEASWQDIYNLIVPCLSCVVNYAHLKGWEDKNLCSRCSRSSSRSVLAPGSGRSAHRRCRSHLAVQAQQNRFIHVHPQRNQPINNADLTWQSHTNAASLGLPSMTESVVYVYIHKAIWYEAGGHISNEALTKLVFDDSDLLPMVAFQDPVDLRADQLTLVVTLRCRPW